MGCTVVRIISEAIQKAQYFSIMANEVTDSSNKEQVVICLRIVDEQSETHEEFVGMYQVDSIKSSSIVEVLKDTIVRLNLALTPRTMLRWSCKYGWHLEWSSRADMCRRTSSHVSHCYGMH